MIKSDKKFSSVAVGKSISYGLSSNGKVYRWKNVDASTIELLDFKLQESSWFSSDNVVQISCCNENFACATRSGKVLQLIGCTSSVFSIDFLLLSADSPLLLVSFRVRQFSILCFYRLESAHSKWLSVRAIPRF